MFWTLIGATAFLIVSAYYISPDYYYMNNTWYSTANEGLLIAGCITSAFANVSLPLMFVFKCAGKGRMNWVADEYNKSRSASAFSYQISPSIMKCNSMESQNNLGVGLTFSLNF